MELFGNMLDWILALFLFGLLLFIHELGHFLMARLTGVKVEEFGFGYPPRLFKLFTWQGTLFSINAIPFGAFVKPVGEDDPHVAGGLAAASKRVRVLVLLGGVIMNAAAAVFSYTVAYKLAFPEGVMVDYVAPDTPAAAAGLLAGDRILALDGVEMRYIKQVSDYTKAHLGQDVTFHISRDGEAMDLFVVPRTSWPQDQGPTGITIMDVYSDRHGWGEAFGESFNAIQTQLSFLLQLPGKIIRGDFNASTDRPVGPVGILDVTEQIVGTAREDNRWVIILSWIGMINLALAVGNILPIPALDGGRLLFVVLEAIRGKRFDPEKERMVHAYTMLVLLFLMMAITCLDIFFPVLPR
jgi:regulator of sigma E protease